MKTKNNEGIIQRLAELPTKLKREKYPLRFLFAKFLVKTGICRTLTIQRAGYRLRFHPSAMSSTLWIGSDRRLDDEQVLERLLQPGDRYVDVGANIGSLVLKGASLVGAGGKVTAIEAHPRTFGFLSQNVDLNPFRNVTLHNCALGNTRGMLHFANQASDDQNCIVDETATDSIPVEVRTLDDLNLGEIDLLKVDVEGYEKFVFEGGQATLARTKAIFFECWQLHCDKYGYAPNEIFRILIDLGFELYLIEAGSATRIDDAFTCPTCVNLVALRNGAEF